MIQRNIPKAYAHHCFVYMQVPPGSVFTTPVLDKESFAKREMTAPTGAFFSSLTFCLPRHVKVVGELYLVESF